jgi:hypothetical protein
MKARPLSVLALLLTATLGHAQVVIHGTVAVAAGGALVDGDQPAFQERFRQRKDGYGGLDDLTVTRTTNDMLFRFQVHAIPGNEDYRLSARWERFDAFYVEANYQQFRTFYDGSGGRFLPRDLAFSYFDENLTLDRSFFSFEIGTLVPDRPQWRLRYDRNTRDGTKNSLRWGDSNLAGAPFVPRAFVPSYLLVDETRDIISAEVSQRTDANNWKVAGRYERTKLDNTHVARRRPLEPADRYVTMRETTDTDLFSGNAFYEHVFTEKLRASAGGMITDIDTNLSGSKIYGATPSADYSPAPTGRQAGDVGYFGLDGSTWLKQYIGNLNVVYEPTANWTFRPGLKYEHLRRHSGEDHFDTDFAQGTTAAIVRQMQSDTGNSWDEFTEEFEARYARGADWNFSARAQLTQGTGNLLEQSILLPAATAVIDRNSDYSRYSQRYLLGATWYARPGLTVSAQYNYRLKIANYAHRVDNTSNAANSPNRYPAFIIDQDIESNDGNLRLSWRPMAMLSFDTRYAYQQSTLTSTMDGLPEIQNGRLRRHVITQSATWNPTARLYLTGAVNFTYDQLAVPPHRLTFNSDNNYVSASLGAGYALGKVTDVFLQADHYRADNYTDNPAVTLPLNAGQTTQSAFLTWVRRQNEHLIYTVKYGYATNRDGTFGGLNNFNAHLAYAKVEYKF